MTARNLQEDRLADAIDRKVEVERQANERQLRYRRLAREADGVVDTFARQESDRALAIEISARKRRQAWRLAEKLPVKSAREAADDAFKDARVSDGDAA